jgi:hypothetical protein
MKEIHRKVPLNTKVLPTSLTKRACEEEMMNLLIISSLLVQLKK